MEINWSKKTYLWHCLVLMKDSGDGRFLEGSGMEGEEVTFGKHYLLPKCSGLVCKEVSNSGRCARLAESSGSSARMGLKVTCKL